MRTTLTSRRVELRGFVVFIVFVVNLVVPFVSADACGDAIRSAVAQNGVLLAVDAYACLTSVPFNPAVATRFVKYWNDTLQFQSTLEYLKNPPPEYQQLPSDPIASLGDIQSTIDHGGFNNQYDFEAAIQHALHSAHDSHVSFIGGALTGTFSFGSYYGLTSVSIDGISLPKVYVTSDLVANQSYPDGSYPVSAIAQINGTDVHDYLARIAALNSYGTLEPHADYNLLFDSPVQQLLGYYSLWSGSLTFYPGDQFTYTFENGSSRDDRWEAVYFNTGPTGPLETGGDLYNWAVLGFWPAACSSDTPDPACLQLSPTSSDAASSSVATESSVPSPSIPAAYPNPDVQQTDGYVAGYFLRDKSLAVLSIPSFNAAGAAIQSFADAVQNFIHSAKDAGIAKVLIDLQQNDGGVTLLAYTAFRLFFPSIDPFAGSERRAQILADALGSNINPFWEYLKIQDPSTYVNASSDEWIATIRTDARSGQNFTSWDDLFGPEFDGTENFTRPERLPITNPYFDFSALGLVNPPDALLSAYEGPAIFAAEDIVMLSDGTCASACSLFMEMMSHDAGVKNVVVGGLPKFGPMQTPSGSRGSDYYSLLDMDVDFANAASAYDELDLAPPPWFPNRTEDGSVFYYGGGVSLRAQVRENDTVPLAMRYLAADCRIFFTPNTFNNFTNLWSYSADAIWTSPELCVQNSTGYSSSSSNPLLPPMREPLSNYTSVVDVKFDGSVAFGYLGDALLDPVPGIYIPRTPLSVEATRQNNLLQGSRSVPQPVTPQRSPLRLPESIRKRKRRAPARAAQRP